MTPEEIIAIDAQKNKGGMDPNENRRSLQTMQAAGAQVIKEGDTLFAFIPGKDLSVELHSFNAAPVNTFIENTKKVLRMLKKLGVKNAWTEFDDLKLKSALDMLAPEFKVSVTKGKRYMAKVVLS
jgi:hypothetical protein